MFAATGLFVRLCPENVNVRAFCVCACFLVSWRECGDVLPDTSMLSHFFFLFSFFLPLTPLLVVYWSVCVCFSVCMHPSKCSYCKHPTLSCHHTGLGGGCLLWLVGESHPKESVSVIMLPKCQRASPKVMCIFCCGSLHLKAIALFV